MFGIIIGAMFIWGIGTILIFAWFMWGNIPYDENEYEPYRTREIKPYYTNNVIQFRKNSLGTYTLP